MNQLLPDVKWPLLAPFWEGCKNNKLLFPFCNHCGTWQWYPTYKCRTCFSDLEWKEVSGEGKLYSWTVVRKAYFPDFKDRLPLIVAVVDIVDAPGVRLVSNIINGSSENLKLDMNLQVVFKEINQNIVYPQFEVVKEIVG